MYFALQQNEQWFSGVNEVTRATAADRELSKEALKV